MLDKGLLDQGNVKLRSMVIPDVWIEQGPQKDQYDIAGLNAPQIVEKVEGLLRELNKSPDNSSNSNSKSSYQKPMSTIDVMAKTTSANNLM